jgi:hypothetical protein
MTDEMSNLILTRLDRVLSGQEELKKRMTAVEKAVVVFAKQMGVQAEAGAHQWEVLDEHKALLDKIVDRLNDQGLRLEKLETQS